MLQSVYSYLNYREFLNDFYHFKKDQHKFYSFRLFSEKAGFKSPNFLKLVIDGQRNLTKESIFKVMKAVGFKKKEADYFENLVFFNQSKSLEEKNHYLKPVMRQRKRQTVHNVEQDELKYFSQWYHPVIRELACSLDFQSDFKKLGRSVIPPISAKEAEDSVNLLLELGYIKQAKNGVHIMANTNVTTGPQIHSVAVSNYHREMITLASQSIERFSGNERNISSLTLNLSEQSIQTLVEKLNQVRQEMLLLAEEDKKANRVMQINFQMFPLSAALKNEGGEQ